MPKMRVVTANNPVEQARVPVIPTTENPRVASLTSNERQVRKLFATTSSMGKPRQATTTSSIAEMMLRTAGDTINSGTSQFYSPQLSTDFLEKPQNLRERRAFYRFFYNTNEIVGAALDIHSTLPLSKLRLVPPKGKNKHMNEYVFKFFSSMCDDMRLFKTLIDVTHEYNLHGNCLRKDALVRTSVGYKAASDVVLGDLLLTDKGRFRKVSHRFVRPAEDVLRIKCWKEFRTLPVTGEHPIEVFREDSLQFVQAGDLRLSDYIRVTWPAETEDLDGIDLTFDRGYEKASDGYTRTWKNSHPRNATALKARRGFVTWLGSLIEPVIKTRKQIAEDLDVPLSVLNSTIYIIGKELDKPFHERIGALGWQKGSQVRWLPTDVSDISIEETYDIWRSSYIKAKDSIKIDTDFAYLVGFWLGDGTLARDSSRDTWGRGLWQICFKETCTDNIDRVRTILHNMFGSEQVSEWNSAGMKFLKVISNPAFVEWWADNFGETTFGKNNKRIPDWFVRLPQEKLLHTFAGLIDSDGCLTVAGINGHHIVCVSMASRTVMDSVRDIALKCGVVVGYTETKERCGVLPNGESVVAPVMYTVTASDEDSCRELTSFANKKVPQDAHFSEMNRYWIRDDEGRVGFKIKSVETENYNDLVYNFEVEEDHTFQVAGFSTHNCFSYAEEADWKEGLSETDIAHKKNEAAQRCLFLKEKYNITDKNPLFKGWKRLLVLPPDQVRVRKLPLSDDVSIEFMPDSETRRFLSSDMPYDPNDPTKPVKYSIPEDIKEKVRRSGVVPMDTDPNTGSHVHLLARKKSQYEPLGVSIVERCVNTLVLMDKLRQAQTSIASRHMTPMRIVWAEQLNDDQVDNLREQVDMALVDPDYSIIANYEIHWEEMGSQGRLLDIESENEACMQRLYAGLGVTREILTGEGSYTGSKISLEIMNQQYLLYREIIQDYVENNLFKPVARKKGFIEYDDYGNEILLYPKLSFTRLSIRDNEQFFSSAFQLYQKGSISVDLILDILNIDPDSTRAKLEQDMFTVNDSIFNEVLRNIYTQAATPLVEKTDIVARLSEYMNLKMSEESAPDTEGQSRFSSENTPQAPVALDEDKKIKLAKVMKHFQSHPDILDKVFERVEQ